MTARVAALPADARPQVHVVGESLGATAGQAIFARPGAARSRQVCSVLWTGTPGGHRVGLPCEVPVANLDDPDTLAFPLRRGLVWRRKRSELFADAGSEASGSDVTGETQDDDLLPGIASLFNGALFSAHALDVVGVPDLRLFFRGDEVEVHLTDPLN